MDHPRRAHSFVPQAVLASVTLLASLPAWPDLAPSTECASSRRGAPDQVQATCFVMQHAGRTRTARIYAGGNVKAAAPLIFVLHGGSGAGSGMELMTRARFNRIADREGAIVAYPDGVDRHWNDGRDIPETTVRENVDDVGFIVALVEALARQHPLDRGRIFATGISNGGFMSMRLACDAATTFAAVAPVTATLSEELGARCQPVQAVAVAIINGTDDPIVPWSGGPIRLFGLARGEIWSAERTFGRWLELDACGERSADARIDRDAQDDTALVIHKGSACRNGVQVWLYEIQGGGHAWPMGVPFANERLVGRTSQELDATEEIWKFLTANARSSAARESDD